MFTATYPASFLPEENGKGCHVRFPDLPEALTGEPISTTPRCRPRIACEAIAGRIRRGDAIPGPSKVNRGQHLVSVPLYLAPSSRSIWRCERLA